jgi:hypothetical protein
MKVPHTIGGMTESENQASNERFSRRDHIRGGLAILLLVSAVLLKYSQAPESWRAVHEKQSRAEVIADLGQPDSERTNQLIWHEDLLIGNWELIVHMDGEVVTQAQQKFRWLWEKPN